MRQVETAELDGLQQQFLNWLYAVMARQGVGCKELMDVEMMQRLAREGKIHTFLDARIQAANAKREAEGHKKGRLQGHKKGRREGRREGRQEGLEEGHKKGLEQQRELLQSLARRRFGAATANRLAARLAEIRDHDRFMAIGDWLLDCASGTELLDRVEGRV